MAKKTSKVAKKAKKVTKKKVTKASKKAKTTKKAKASAVKVPVEEQIKRIKTTKRLRPNSNPDFDYENYTMHPVRQKLQSKRIYGNEEKKRIAVDMLERYTGHSIDDFQDQIILTNFHYYVTRFNAIFSDHHYTKGSAFKASTSKKARVTIIEFGVGSAMAALIGELVSVVSPRAVLFLGLAGAVHRSLKVGDFVLPIASIRAEGVSNHFLPPQVPALPTFKIQKFVSQILVEHGYDYRTGTIHSTDLRFWEFDERFKENLIKERVLAVEMETAALFTSCFVSKVNIGALLLISDCPLKRGGIKTKASAKSVFKKYTDLHIELGIKAMADIAERGEKIRHYTW